MFDVTALATRLIATDSLTRSLYYICSPKPPRKRHPHVRIARRRPPLLELRRRILPRHPRRLPSLLILRRVDDRHHMRRVLSKLLRVAREEVGTFDPQGRRDADGLDLANRMRPFRFLLVKHRPEQLVAVGRVVEQGLLRRHDCRMQRVVGAPHGLRQREANVLHLAAARRYVASPTRPTSRLANHTSRVRLDGIVRMEEAGEGRVRRLRLEAAANRLYRVRIALLGRRDHVIHTIGVVGALPHFTRRRKLVGAL